MKQTYVVPCKLRELVHIGEMCFCWLSCFPRKPLVQSWRTTSMPWELKGKDGREQKKHQCDGLQLLKQIQATTIFDGKSEKFRTSSTLPFDDFLVTRSFFYHPPNRETAVAQTLSWWCPLTCASRANWLISMCCASLVKDAKWKPVLQCWAGRCTR